jgi:MFS family permease
MRKLFRVPFARRYLLGQSLSVLGDSSLWLAMAIWVRELTGSNAAAGLTFFFLTAPGLAGPVWGTAVDRYRRRPILIGVNAAAGLMTLSLLVVQGRGQIWVIWLVMAGYGVSNSVLSGAQSGFLKTLIPDDSLGDAQGLLMTVREGLRLVSPLIGAGLFSVFGARPVIIVDAVTFAIATISVASIRVKEPAPVRIAQRLRTEVSAGWTHIRSHVRIRQVVAATVAVCAVIGFTETGIVAVVTDGLHRSPTWIGPFEVLMGAGALVGGPTVGPAMRRFGEGRVCAAGMVVFALGSSVLIIPTIGTVAAGAVLDGIGVPWVVAAAMTLIQRESPDELQGRVSTTVDVLAGTPQSLSIALGAGLLAVVGYQWLMGAVGVVTMVAGLWLLSRPEQRVGSPGAAAAGGVTTTQFVTVDPQQLVGSHAIGDA